MFPRVGEGKDGRLRRSSRRAGGTPGGSIVWILHGGEGTCLDEPRRVGVSILPEEVVR